MMRDVEIPDWLKGLPLAPEFHPTDTEFADPIAYISKIEKEAGAFGICKIIPPLPKPSKKYVLSNLNKSLNKCPDLVSDVNLSTVSRNCDNDGEVPAVFTSRHQELGQNVKKSRVAGKPQQQVIQRQVWQSGEVYTIEQFENKSKAFAKNILGMVKEASPLIVESLFWKATSEKPIYIEYANDVPGSGFSEPEGSYRYFLKRKRKRIFKKNCGITLDNSRNRCNVENSVASSSEPGPKIPVNIRSYTCSGTSILSSDESLEGTAGWKLSNSPWNLQVIARSPGSITRFMPDDIPGVTSPMVYIGMLFSWFAWHVEDHELHSMNYMHTGSAKTWYAVPGDHAYDFEEVVRSQTRGGNIDHLAALKLLGQKTTLLSPQLVVASGIPCCRLVQHPGEFVVTFPRAYHVGFSHGFNCGEAANFGTPQWLEVAKEAAVRRAAMNHLPMLSHQQLLYLLAMSFISRVPRSLLPGARSSRLRDRQKEEREKSIKRSFIEDIMKENQLSNILLARESTYRAVLWDPQSLPSLPSEIGAVDIIPKEILTNIHHDDNNISKNNNLLDEMNSFMENVNDLYLDNDDDLSCDFQVDSGSLPCVACGILGFPFMAVIQPSKRSSMELINEEQALVENCTPLSNSINTQSSEKLCSVPDQLLPQEEGILISSQIKVDKTWNASNGIVRPRIFCLEHAVQIEELLRSKGGADVLVICHSDYQKMKAHVAVIAEEIRCSRKYKEVPLDRASQQDLNLINLAIDKEGHDDGESDWTSDLGINLKHCVKMRKKSPSTNVQHSLKLNGLFSDTTPDSTLSIKWHSRKSRSKSRVNQSLLSKPPSRSIQLKSEKAEDINIVRKEEKIIIYSRRNFKSKLSKAGEATCRDLDKSEDQTSKEISMDMKACPTGDDVILGAESSKMLKEIVTEEITATNEDSKQVTCTPDLFYHADLDGMTCDVHLESKNVEIFSTNIEFCDRGPTCRTEEIVSKENGTENELCSGTSMEDDSVSSSLTLLINETSVSIEEESPKGNLDFLPHNIEPTEFDRKTIERKERKRKREVELLSEGKFDCNGFFRSPCEGLRPRMRKDDGTISIDDENPVTKKPTDSSVSRKGKNVISVKKWPHGCDLEGCKMSFKTKAELMSHKRNQCPYPGCGKKFSSHNYTIRHARVHDDDRPLKCPWKGCTVSFKWAWARTEHLRVHTGERPYQCKVEDCGLSFRFISDFSRHRRKTGHYVE